MIERVDPASWRAARWAHGETFAVKAWTDDAGGVIARISVATIEAPGPFSIFAGCERWLCVLDDGGGLQLGATALATGDVLAFSGDLPIEAAPIRTARVLNVIARRDVTWQASRLAAGDELIAAPGVIAVFAIEALTVDDLTLDRHAAAIITAHAPRPLRVDGPAIVVELALDR